MIKRLEILRSYIETGLEVRSFQTNLSNSIQQILKVLKKFIDSKTHHENETVEGTSAYYKKL